MTKLSAASAVWHFRWGKSCLMESNSKVNT
jgi:hypothetical protein